MAQVFANAARAKLAAPLLASDTTLTLDDGSAFPVADTGAGTPGAGSRRWFRAVLQDAEGIEVVLVRSHTAGGNVLADLVRGQEGTTARAFAAGTVCGVRWTAGDAQDVAQAVARLGGAAAMTLTRDAQGRLATVDYAQGGQSGSVTLARSAEGVLTSIVESAAGRTTTSALVRDAGGRLAQVTVQEA